MMHTPQIDLVRGRALGLRADDAEAEAAGDGMPTMVGHFSLFDTWYEIDSWYEGRFLERFVRGAYSETFAQHWDDDDPHRIKSQFQHGYDARVGMLLLGQFADLREDLKGGYYEVPLFDTSYNHDLVPGLAANEYGASFRFRVLKESWDDEPGVSDHNPDGLPERTITAARVFEIGPVAFGASPTATAGLRCLTDQYYELLRERSPSLFEDACRAAGVEIPTGRVDPRRTTGGGQGHEPTPADQATTHTLPSSAVRHTDLILRGVIAP